MISLLSLITICIMFVVSFIYRISINPNEMRDLKKQIEKYRIEADKARKNNEKEKAEKLMNEMLKVSQKQLRLNLKPLMISGIVFLLTLSWMSRYFTGFEISLPFSIVFLGNSISWFLWYILLAITSTQIFRKLLDVD
ncbi:MAG: EMC3/TMCO1 family protein [Candidatus Aenigmatarchaeota archaeon]